MKDYNETIKTLLYKLQIPEFVINPLIKNIDNIDKQQLEDILFNYIKWIQTIKYENKVSKIQVSKATRDYINTKTEITEKRDADIILSNYY